MTHPAGGHTVLSERPLDVRCPVCAEVSVKAQRIPGWGEWRVCRGCTLQFADPLSRGQDPQAFFEDAYQGRLEESSLMDFHKRLKQRTVILEKLKTPLLWFWTPAYDEILSWLKQRLSSRGTILEIGCGLGFFLHTLRNEGFDAVGLDVAEVAVDLNRRDGFLVWEGPIETMPVGWVDPDAIVSFFVLHHLEDPLSFLSRVREYAPTAPLALAVYGPTNVGTDASLPPRTLLRWNGRALVAALERAGYRAVVREIASTGVETAPFRIIRRIMSSTSAVPPLYRVGKGLERILSSIIPHRLQKPAYVLVALAEPVGGEDPTSSFV